jgi:predicted enzyme related to lactoylglutathione lyase
MELQFAEIQNFVTDLKRARAFYEKVLALKIKKESLQWVIYDLFGKELVVMSGANPQPSQNDYGKTTGTAICLLSKDIEKDSEYLKQNGVKTFGEIRQFPEGKLFAFADPDGNLFELIQ